MKRRVRTFAAVDLDPVICEGAMRMIDRLRTAGADVKWVRPENLHLTVKFLGEVDNHELYDVCRTVQAAVGPLPPFAIEVRGLGAFPKVERPRTVWLGITQGAEQLEQLSDRVDAALEPFGFRRETRRFHAHITLGRVRRPGPALRHVTSILLEEAETEIGLSHVEELVIYSSDLEPEGPLYKPLGHAELTGDRPDSST